MNSNKNTILGRVKSALEPNSPSSAISRPTFSELTQAVANADPTPSASKLPEIFKSNAIKSAATTHEFDHTEQALEFLVARARQQSPLPSFRFGDNATEYAEQFHEFNTPDVPPLKNSWGLAKAWAGIAETGTIVSTSQDCASGTLLLVEHLFLIVNKNDIVFYQEQVWQKLHQRFSGQLPRTINLITGPSRTGDVEQTLQLGAHGPRWVDYLLVNE